jgi:Fe-S-cluster containining protein
MAEKEGISCKRCGRCCLTDLIAYVTDEDRERWKAAEREDIFHILEHERALWAGDRIVSSTNGRVLQGCPFIMWEGELATCSIYETRPRICRDYEPGSSELCSQFVPRTAP